MSGVSGFARVWAAIATVPTLLLAGRRGHQRWRGPHDFAIDGDGYPLDAPYSADNVLVSPGDRVDVIVDATEPGTWAWHCHILHAEGPDGMFGMVNAMIVEE